MRDLGVILLMGRKHKENNVTANVFVEPHVRELMKHNARKDQRYSDYILELIQYKQEHERSHD